MTIEISLLLSGISVAFAVYLGMARQSREKEASAKSDASAMTTVVVKLQAIETGIAEIKTEIFCIKNDFKADHDRLTRLEATRGRQPKAAHADTCNNTGGQNDTSNLN